MRIAFWNINSVRARAERAVEFLRREEVDVLAMQEIKCKPEQFPYEVFEQAGYEVACHGINQWNGVAIVSRVGLSEVEKNFPGQPKYANEGKEPIVEPRAISAVCDGVRVFSLYIPNGRELTHPHYAYKLQFMNQLNQHVSGLLQADASAQIALMGDWNVAPLDSDVWDIGVFEGCTHVSAAEREAFYAFESSGLVEATRSRFDGYTYWDYKALRFVKNEGMRIDFAYVSPALDARISKAFVDREERKGKGASDHAPVILQLD